MRAPARAGAKAENLGTAAKVDRWKSDDGQVEIVSTELLFCDATDLTADLLGIAGPAGAGFAAGGGGGRVEAIAALARELTGGKLVGYLTRVLANTSLIVRGAGAGNYSLRTRAELDTAFTGRQQFIFPAVALALEVSLTGFLDGLVLIGFDLRTMMATTKAESPSEDSSPNTSATG